MQPILKQYCLDCHSTEKQKGELDLERFKTVAEVMKHAKVWQGVWNRLRSAKCRRRTSLN
ncbi:MAG: hypothetical protein IPK15_08030 [Verrucomicrobia bacterium]|nr:hypothetical protein [Verrucomicrobiota bacterium]